MNAREVVRERHVALHAGDVIERIGIHKRVAIAITADPHADLEKRGQLGLCAVVRFKCCECVLHQARHFTQETYAEIRQRIVYFVTHAKFCEPKHGGLPKLQDVALQRRFALRFIQIRISQRGGNRALAIENALPFDLCRMRSERGAHKRAREAVPDFAAADLRVFQMRERRCERTRLRRRARTFMKFATTILLHIFGDVREV